MKVFMLLRSPERASSRYRAMGYVEYLEAAGARVEVRFIPRGWLARRRLFRHAADFDSVFLQRRLLPLHMLAYLRRRAARLVYDFDDAILYHAPSSRQSESGTRRRRFEATLKAADLVIAGNDYLRRLARPHARKIMVLPTVLDPAKYDRAAAARAPGGDCVTLGWIGGRSSVHYLVSIRDALEQIGASRAGVRLKIVCNEFPEFRNISVEEKRWSEEDEAEDVASFDIGLGPYSDDPWSLGKCALKTLQYMAASLPVVCSPLGAQREIVRDGVNGLWASDTAEWVDRLNRLVASADERTRMGKAGRKILGEGYTLERAAPRFIEAVTGRGRGESE